MKLIRNTDNEESRKWWEAVKEAAASAPKLSWAVEEFSIMWYGGSSLDSLGLMTKEKAKVFAQTMEVGKIIGWKPGT